MNFLSLIESEREGKTLAPEQIQEFIREFAAGKSRRRKPLPNLFLGLS
jgi:hypothetical protein